jgi:hypothetical protein
MRELQKEKGKKRKNNHCIVKYLVPAQCDNLFRERNVFLLKSTDLRGSIRLLSAHIFQFLLEICVLFSEAGNFFEEILESNSVRHGSGPIKTKVSERYFANKL